MNFDEWFDRNEEAYRQEWEDRFGPKYTEAQFMRSAFDEWLKVSGLMDVEPNHVEDPEEDTLFGRTDR